VRLVKDTNVFVAALKSGAGASRKMLRLLLSGAHTPLLGDKLCYEYQDLIGRGAEIWAGCPLTDAERRELLQALVAVCTYVRITRLWRPNLRDEGDNHVMELAICGNAAALVTFNLRDFAHALFAPPGLEVLPPGEFLRRYST
jgi:predicted nucleic acid-binding protein